MTAGKQSIASGQQGGKGKPVRAEVGRPDKWVIEYIPSNHLGKHYGDHEYESNGAALAYLFVDLADKVNYLLHFELQDPL